METGDNAVVQDGEVPPPLPMDINNRQMRNLEAALAADFTSRHSLRDHATFAPLREPWPVSIAQSFSEIGTRCADSTERNAKRVKQMETDEIEDTESVECLADLTVHDWFDMLGVFFYQLGVMAAGFGIVVLAATLLTKWILIPVLRTKGWCV